MEHDISTPGTTSDEEVLAPQIIAPGIQRDLEKEVIRGFMANIIIYPLLLIFHSIVFWYITTRATPNEFIDEKFHASQTRAYLCGKWLSWNGKITTPPGLYLLGWLQTNILKKITNWSSLNMMRSVNLIGGVVVFPLTVLRPLFLFNAIGFWPVALMCFPLLSTYYNLYYTDVWSTLFILQSLTIAITQPWGSRKSIWLSSSLAGVSCLFRQTNIIWTGFIMLIAIERSAIISKGFTSHSPNNYLKLFIHSVDEFRTLTLPYIINFMLFFIYLIWNRSITLGDKSNHSAGLHLVQLFYCLMFITLFSLPVWLSKSFIRMYTNRIQRKPIQTLFEYLGILIIIRYFTRVHPFLLADNRHFTFYLFKRLIGSKRKLIKYILMPSIYHFSTFSYIEVMRPNEFTFDTLIPISVKDPVQLPIQLTHISWTALIICTILTIVPSPLFEPRYYILPYFFWRLFVTSSAEPFISNLKLSYEEGEILTISSTKRLALELAWFVCINLLTLFVFVRYTFHWDTEPFLQRIIW